MHSFQTILFHGFKNLLPFNSFDQCITALDTFSGFMLHTFLRQSRLDCCPLILTITDSKCQIQNIVMRASNDPILCVCIFTSLLPLRYLLIFGLIYTSSRSYLVLICSDATNGDRRHFAASQST